MDTAAILALMGAGAFLEGLAFALVWRDARAAGLRLQVKIQKRPQLVQAGPASAHARALGVNLVGGTPPVQTEPTLESRLREVEERVSALQARLEAAGAHTSDVRDSLQAEISRQVAEARREAFERPLDVREELANEIASNLPARIVLFLVGLALATAGNVWSVLA